MHNERIPKTAARNRNIVCLRCIIRLRTLLLDHSLITGIITENGLLSAPYNL